MNLEKSMFWGYTEFVERINSIVLLFVGVVLLVGGTLLGIYVFTWQSVEWGSIKMGQERTITVRGSSYKQEDNKVAEFTAGVSVTKDDKDKAIEEVNTKAEEIIEAVKDFGIDSKDIKTQNLSVSQSQDRYWDDESQRYKQRPGQWRVSNSVRITLREVDKASELTALLADTGATNVYGPNLRVDIGEQSGDDLLGEAVQDAREKAEKLASQMGVKVVEVIRVMEGGVEGGIRPMMLDGLGAGGGGVPIEPGSSRVSKTVTVVFRIR